MGVVDPGVMMALGATRWLGAANAAPGGQVGWVGVAASVQANNTPSIGAS